MTTGGVGEGVGDGVGMGGGKGPGVGFNSIWGSPVMGAWSSLQEETGIGCLRREKECNS